jgi:type I restriction enzyme S subunit
MKKYDNYKDSGIEWIGKVPEHWKVRRIKHVFNFQKGKNPPDLKTEKSEFAQVYLAMDYLRDKPKQVFYVENPELFVNVVENEILLLWDGSNAGEFIRAKNGVLSSTMAQIKSVDLNYDFSWYFFKHFEKSLKDSSVGMGIPHVDGKFLKNSVITVPESQEEQTTIANYLDQKTSQIDQLINQKKRFIELLQEERTAVINQAVTKGLDPTVKMKDSGIEWLGEIPEHWEVKRIKYLGKILSGYSFKSDDFIEDSGCRVMKISNIQTMKIDWSDESFVPYHFCDKYSNFKVNKGDLVFALTRPIISTGIKASIVDSDESILLNQRNAVVRPTKMLDVNWMYYLVFNPRFINHFESLIDKTGQQPNISSTDISNIAIPLPSREEQKKIIEYISQEEIKINTIISKTQQEIELLKEYKTALISEVVTGKVDVRDVVLN